MRLTKDQLYRPSVVVGSEITSTSSAQEAQNIAIEDAGSIFTAENVEAALQELAGTGRTSESVKGNADNLVSHKNQDGSGGTSEPATNKVHNAAAIALIDSGDRIVATDVESALQEKSMEIIQASHRLDTTDDDFPIRQCWYRNHQADNTLSTAEGTNITIQSISTTGGTFGGVAYDGYIVVSWMPYRSTLISPTAGHEWAFIDTYYHNGGAEPGRTGDYTERYKIIGCDFAQKRLYYVLSAGSAANLAAGHKVLIYNPWEEATGWEWLNSGNYLIGQGAAGSWRDLYVDCGNIFQRSDGTYIMLVSGRKNGSPKQSSIGAFQSTDLISWSVMNSDQPIFTYSGLSDWRNRDCVCTNGFFYLDSEDRYFLLCNGTDVNGKSTIGWIKFKEDFTQIEYASTALKSNASYSYSFPSMIKYGSIYRMIYVLDEAPVDIDNWKYKMATSKCPEGPFTDDADIWDASILSAIRSHDGLWCSSHFTDIRQFVWKNRLWALAFGCAKYNASGNRGNLEIGLMYWDERKATPSWVMDKRSPIFINAAYANASLWPGVTWMADHAGGRENFFLKDDYLYIFHGGSQGTDTYRICGRRLKLTVK